MKSLFNPKDNKEYIDRINNLNPQSKAQWDKMNAAQMLAHTQVPFNVATGEARLKRGLLGILFGKMAKKKYLTEALGKNKKAQKTFDNFSYTNKKEYVDWITETKNESTREKRMDSALEWMSGGKIRHWKYLKK